MNFTPNSDEAPIKSGPLWISRTGEPLSVRSLRTIVTARW
jgi:hypothetical protein